MKKKNDIISGFCDYMPYYDRVWSFCCQVRWPVVFLDFNISYFEVLAAKYSYTSYLLFCTLKVVFSCLSAGIFCLCVVVKLIFCKDYFTNSSCFVILPSFC